MKILAIVLTALISMTTVVGAQGVPKDFSQIELGAMVTSPNVEGDRVGVVPSFMLKQAVIEGFFTLQALETNLGTDLLDTTAFKLGFGYQLPKFSLFNINQMPVWMTADLLFAKDLASGIDNNSIVGAGITFNRDETNNRALVLRAFWNRVRNDNSTPWRTVWSGIVALELGLL